MGKAVRDKIDNFFHCSIEITRYNYYLPLHDENNHFYKQNCLIYSDIGIYLASDLLKEKKWSKNGYICSVNLVFWNENTENEHFLNIKYTKRRIEIITSNINITKITSTDTEVPTYFIYEDKSPLISAH